VIPSLLTLQKALSRQRIYICFVRIVCILDISIDLLMHLYSQVFCLYIAFVYYMYFFFSNHRLAIYSDHRPRAGLRFEPTNSKDGYGYTRIVFCVRYFAVSVTVLINLPPAQFGSGHAHTLDVVARA